MNILGAGDTYGGLDGQRKAGEDYLFVSKLDSSGEDYLLVSKLDFSEYRLKTSHAGVSSPTPPRAWRSTPP